jgi:DNA-binding CsgD family transcriptional regulator
VRVLNGLADHRTEREIAERNGIDYTTVRSHVTAS